MTETETTRGGLNRTVAMLPEICKFTYCEACEQIMPPRSEHCETCDVCVLRVDQHCAWLGNKCIGLLNQKFFILYLFYTLYFCFQVSVPFFKLLIIGVDDPKEDGVPHNILELICNYPNEFIAFVFAISLLVSFSFMFLYQIAILYSNKTTMEVSMDEKRSPFKHNGIVRNFEMVFG